MSTITQLATCNFFFSLSYGSNQWVHVFYCHYFGLATICVPKIHVCFFRGRKLWCYVFCEFHDNWHVIKESESTGVLQNVILLINTSVHFISSTSKSLGVPKLSAKLHGLEYEYVSTTFLEKLGYKSRVRVLINYLISIFMYNLNIFRISFPFPCLCVFISQKKKKKAWKHI